MAATHAMRRLCQDLKQLERQKNPQLSVRPSERSMLEWHFAVHHLPDDTVYAGGCYHGKLIFPEKYPLSPPSLIMVTPSGRLEVNKRLCLSMTDFHPESWNPAWTVESILVGLISFMVDDSETKSVGAIMEATEVRRRLAARSIEFNRLNPEFCELFPELVEAFSHADAAAPAGGSAEAARAGAAAPGHPHEPTPPEGERAEVAGPAATALAGRAAAAAGAPTTAAAEASGEAADAARLCAATGSATRMQDAATDLAVAPAEPAAPQAPDSSPDGPGAQEEAEECWICREGPDVEPLIQPCACRGSMSGVHASCVEEWIAHHRANAINDEPPKCSVCNEIYSGTERRPGALLFAGHLCNDCARQVARSAALVLLLIAYWTAAQDDVQEVWKRVVLFVVSGAAFLYKSLVLTASLPRGRPPPENCFKHLFTSDQRAIAVHVTELAAIVMIIGLWSIFEQLTYPYILPIVILAAMPMGAVVAHSGVPRASRVLAVVAALALSPVLLLIHLGRLVARNPKVLADPTDAIFHMFVPTAAIPVAFFVEKVEPILYLLACHSVVLGVSLIEKLTVQKVRWKEGRVWWLFVQLAVLTAYITNLVHNFSADFLKDGKSLAILGVSALWLGLSCGLALSVNWGLCVRQYRAWQNRHGSFELQAVAPAARPAGNSAAPATHGTVMLEPERIGAPAAAAAEADRGPAGRDAAVRPAGNQLV